MNAEGLREKARLAVKDIDRHPHDLGVKLGLGFIADALFEIAAVLAEIRDKDDKDE